jgi:ACT domain-containing protein
MSEGVDPETYTVRLELDDEPGELLAALSPIAEHGGNLLSVFHERGNLTPRGRIPVAVDLAAPPGGFEAIVAALRESGVTVVRAGEERYAEELTVLLVGHVVDTDLSDTLRRLADDVEGTVSEVSVSAPDGTEEVSSARLRLRVPTGGADEALATLRTVAGEKDLRVVEPLVEASG